MSSRVQAVSKARWEDAQEAEAGFWAGSLADAPVVADSLAQFVSAAAWIRARQRELRPTDAVELGVGPLGLGCSHFLVGDHGRIVGVDPLPLAPIGALDLPGPILSAVEACRAMAYRHVVATGEQTGLDDASFDFAEIHNALDHVRDPLAVLREAHRVLRPGGTLYVGCDVFSVVGLAYFHAVAKRRFPDSVYVRAHPFRLRATELVGLVREAGFHQVHAEQQSLPKRVVGSIQMLKLVARRPC